MYGSKEGQQVKWLNITERLAAAAYCRRPAAIVHCSLMRDPPTKAAWQCGAPKSHLVPQEISAPLNHSAHQPRFTGALGFCCCRRCRCHRSRCPSSFPPS